MKLLGIFEVHRLHRHPVSGKWELPWGVLQQDLSPVARAVVAKIARSEVKNYLAELAEQADIPFISPLGFVTALQGASRGVASGDLTVVVTRPDGHTNSCTCPEKGENHV